MKLLRCFPKSSFGCATQLPTVEPLGEETDFEVVGRPLVVLFYWSMLRVGVEAETGEGEGTVLLVVATPDKSIVDSPSWI